MDIKELRHREFVAWSYATTSTLAFFATMGFLHWWCLGLVPFLVLSFKELSNVDKAIKIAKMETFNDK